MKIRVGDLLGLDALKLGKLCNIFLFHQFLFVSPRLYYQNAHPFLTSAGIENPTGKMAIGQISKLYSYC
jgi:hypothetical protein